MNKKILRRYTNIPALLHLLNNKAITLLNPNTWEDRNDSFYLNEYKQKKELLTVLALCFTEAPETYHHWKIFAGGNSSGICIYFKKDEFIEYIGENKNIFHKRVSYKTLDEMEEKTLSLKKLPFVKRYAFRDEKEYRIIYEEKETAMEFKELFFDVSHISKISLSPWMPINLVDTVKNYIKRICPEIPEINVTKSALLDNKKWKNFAKQA